ERKQPLAQTSHRVAFLDHEHRGPDDNGELGDLGWLYAGAEQIPARAVYSRSPPDGERKYDNDEQDETHDHRWPRQVIPSLRVELRAKAEQYEPERHSAKLAQHVIGAVVSRLKCHD